MDESFKQVYKIYHAQFFLLAKSKLPFGFTKLKTAAYI